MNVLTNKERLALFGISLVALVIAVCTAIHPLQLKSEERDSSGKTTKTTVTDVDRKEVILLLTAVSFVGVLFGINGSRFSKFTVGSVSAETRAPEVEAAKAAENQTIEKFVLKSMPSEKEIQPLGSSSGRVILSKKAVDVFSRDNAPKLLVNNVLDEWSLKTLPKPKSLSELEFAARQSDQEDSPWILKFTGSPPIQLSYDERGYTEGKIHNQD